MRTLVLNAGYEPLSVVTSRRALLLVASEKASILADGGEPVVGPSCVLARPAVILLHRYIRPPHGEAIAVSRRGVLRRDGHRCAYCGRTATTVDHVHPRSRGGADSWENLVACCLSCNNVKGDRLLSQLGWTLQVTPGRPRGPHWRILELEKPAEQWTPFLAQAA